MKNDYLRDLKSTKFDNEKLTPEFCDFVKAELLPELNVITGYKKKEKIKTASQIIANLILASNRNMTVSDSRDQHKPGVKMRIPIWDALVNHKLAISCLGSELSGKVTRYYATSELRRRLREWQLMKILDVQLERNSQRAIPISDALVVLRPTKKIRKSKDEVLAIPESEIEFVEQVENQLDFINRSNLRHSWIAFVTDERGRERADQPNVMLQQKHSGKFFDWVRIYTAGRWGGQGLPKEIRQKMLIDGQPVAELDFQCSQLRLLYHLSKQDPDRESDLYHPEQIMPIAHRRRKEDTRKLVKLATTITMNTRNKVHAAKTIESEVVKTERLQGLLELQRINAATLVRRIESQHSVPLVASMSPALMTLESTIMLQICMKFALQGSIIGERELSEAEQLEVFGELKPEARTGTPFGKPVLPIHDAVLCKESEIDFAEQTMMDVYHEIMGFNPVIKREF